MSENILFISVPNHPHSQTQQLGNEETAHSIMGVMLESNLEEGRQDIPKEGRAGLKYGQSVTDACISWEQTVPLLDSLRAGVQARRKLQATKSLMAFRLMFGY